MNSRKMRVAGVLPAFTKYFVPYRRIVIPFVSFFLSFLAVSCGSEMATSGRAKKTVFDNGSGKRNMVVVISDLHLGNNLDYAETNTNIDSIANFLRAVNAGASVKELVIAGDLIDEWYVPAYLPAHDGAASQNEFVRNVRKSNQTIFDILDSIIKNESIRVTYVPGNHDLAVTEKNIDLVLPRIKQSRDSIQGLGKYSPVGFPEIVIEHGHRYNIFCAPDMYSNQDIAKGTILPPGYFFTRIAAQWEHDSFPKSSDKVPVIDPVGTADSSQHLAYVYWENWTYILDCVIPINESYDSAFIRAQIDSFSDIFSVNDILPYVDTVDGKIKMALFSGIQDTWHDRQAKNMVKNHLGTEYAIETSAVDTVTDNQANNQYFSQNDDNARIVVFGHTHKAMVKVIKPAQKDTCIYANSGTWIDRKDYMDTDSLIQPMTFLVITLEDSSDVASRTRVELYDYNSKNIGKLRDSASVRIK